MDGEKDEVIKRMRKRILKLQKRIKLLEMQRSEDELDYRDIWLENQQLKQLLGDMIVQG